MVATLVRLRWRLTLNSLRVNVWALIGTIVGALYGLGLLLALVAGAIGLGGLGADAAAAAVMPSEGGEGKGTPSLTSTARTVSPRIRSGDSSTAWSVVRRSRGGRPWPGLRRRPGRLPRRPTRHRCR